MEIVKSRKKVYFEFMRIIACALVIFNHLSGYTLYYSSSGIKQYVYMCLTMITRINVPLFFMISGALLLEKDENITEVFKKRISRIVLILFLFEGFIYTISFIKTGSTNYLYGFIRGFLGESISGAGAYWYLYAYLGFLCVLPFMQRIAHKMQREEFFVILIIHFISSSCVPLLNVILNKFAIIEISISVSFNVPFAFIKAFFIH